MTQSQVHTESQAEENGWFSSAWLSSYSNGFCHSETQTVGLSLGRRISSYL